MSQSDKAKFFRSLHISGDPIVLYNIWDAGGAKAVAVSGAKALATGSWSIAAAHGYEDGEVVPLDFALQIISRIAQSTDLPLTVDFEGGYAEAAEEIAANVRRVIAAGAIGINFEDQIVKGAGLYPIPDQMKRIKALRKAAEHAGMPLFINARTDMFLKAETGHAALLDEAVSRQAAYTEAGADGFFVPGLTDDTLIVEVCKRSSRPINVMMTGPLASVAAVTRLGVARASFGPVPYLHAQDDFISRLAAVS